MAWVGAAQPLSRDNQQASIHSKNPHSLSIVPPPIDREPMGIEVDREMHKNDL